MRRRSHVILTFTACADVQLVGILAGVLWNRDDIEKKIWHQVGVDVQPRQRLRCSDQNRQQGQSARFRILVEDVVVENGTANVLLSGLCGWMAFSVRRIPVRTVHHVFYGAIHSPAMKENFNQQQEGKGNQRAVFNDSALGPVMLHLHYLALFLVENIGPRLSTVRTAENCVHSHLHARLVIYQYKPLKSHVRSKIVEAS